MDKTAEQTYTDLFDQLSRFLGGDPERLAAIFGEVERLHSAGQITDWQLQNAREAYARTGGSQVGDAARWVAEKAAETAKDTLHAAARQVRERAGTAVSSYTRKEPVRAMLIAAATGAILMGLVSSMARSGARTVRRGIRR